MANIVKTDRCNVNFQGNNEGVVDAPGYRFYHEEMLAHVCEVTYQLSESDLARINETGRINMYYVGDTIQPQLMSTEFLSTDELTN